jgi:hypothetical protein
MDGVAVETVDSVASLDIDGAQQSGGMFVTWCISAAELYWLCGQIVSHRV